VQKEKVYVQHRIREDGAEIWRLLERGAHFYVCGDAAHMAGDVHQALLEIIATQGRRTPAQAEEYIKSLEKHRRYQKDVWVT
jgi:sulfite reductase (NADPH) flavoprotein alpha-component